METEDVLVIGCFSLAFTIAIVVTIYKGYSDLKKKKDGNNRKK